jgi:uncharacterized protein YutE (UPF0331/DUF86 family)
MRETSPQLPNTLSQHVGIHDLERAQAYWVDTYDNLLKIVARLAYANRDHLLFFRGQGNDYRNKGNASTFYPTIYRGERVTSKELRFRFDILESASNQLCDLLKEKDLEGHRDVRRRRHVQWSILQHYEVCATPLLDFTHSLRVACSFAWHSTDSEDPYVFVFGLPYLTNRISINTEEEIVNVRLLSICPPDALRPYYQEGYLAGTEEVTDNYTSKSELDFNRRLLAKFRISKSSTFWQGGATPIPKLMLYPKNDKMVDLCSKIKRRLDETADVGILGRFLQAWAELESKIMLLARREDRQIYSIANAIQDLQRRDRIEHGTAQRLDRLREFRNKLVHDPHSVESHEADAQLIALSHVLDEFGR